MSQGKERHKLSGIFAQATIAHLGVAKLALDAPDRVFRFSADAGLEHALQCLGPVHKARVGVHADVRFHPKVPLLAQQSVDLRKHLFPKIHGTAADRTAFLPSPHLTDRTTAAKSGSEATSRLRKADVPFSLPARTAQSIPPVHPKRA